MKALIFSALVLTSQMGWAATFAEDLGYLKYAADFANISSQEMDRFLDPTKGPLHFRLNGKNAPWAGYYFPMKYGGIAHRWQAKELPMETLTKEQIQEAGSERLRELSPIEKYDLLKGDLEWKATQFEIYNRGPLRENRPESWEGFCNGIRCAGIITPEPKFSVEMLSPLNVKVTFEPADIKALLGASYFYVEKYAGLGAPSRNKSRAENQPNPAIFDMALRYNLATKRKTFVIDTSLNDEIWNETIVGYDREIGEIKPLTGSDLKLPQSQNAVKKVRIEVSVSTLGEISIADSNAPTKGDVGQGSYLQEVKTAYTLYLDDKGRAVDGVWHNKRGNRGIDFAWFAAGKGTDSTYERGNTHLSYSRLRKILKESINPSCGKLFF